MAIEYIRLGILKVGNMYVRGEKFDPSNAGFLSLLLSEYINEARLFPTNTADRLAIKYNGKVIPITIKQEVKE